MQVEAVLFDFDLTLADSTAGAEASINHALTALGFARVDRTIARGTVGLSLVETFRHLTGCSDPPLAQRFAELFVQKADEVMAETTYIYPEVPAVLSRLHKAGVRMGIVSTKFRYRIEKILRREGLLGHIGIIIGGEDVKVHKPDPTGLCTAMNQLGARPECSVYVGDHVLDAETARGAGTAFVAVLTGAAQPGDFDEYQPLAVLESLATLPAVLHGRD